jgi:hypothetical protein
MKGILKAEFDGRKSFYGKAMFYTDPKTNRLILESYNSKVCYVENNQVFLIKGLWDYSPTTLRHVKEFVRLCGFEINNLNHKSEKEQMINDFQEVEGLN